MNRKWRHPRYLIHIAFCLIVVCAFYGPQSIQASQGNEIKIVKEGQGNAIVLIAQDADDRTVNAAQTLVDYVEKSTGAVLPIMTESDPRHLKKLNAKTKIYVGLGKSDPHLPGLMQGMDGDGFVIHPHGKNVIIAGPSSWGTEYGVLEFLERYVGVRWLMPGPNGEDVPQLIDLSIPKETVQEEPAFISRLLSPYHSQYGQNNPEQGEWAEKNRMHGRIDFHHNVYTLFPSEIYGESNPEFYPIKNGVRYIPPVGRDSSWQPCYSEPGTVAVATARIIEYFNNNPEAESFSLGVNDDRGYCETQPGHPLRPTELNTVGLLDMSDIYYGWVNQVVEGVLEVHPNKRFGLLAYDHVMSPPSFELNSHVIPFITQDRMTWIDADVKQAAQSQLDSWRLVAEQVAWYDYIYGATYLLPRVYPQLMADNYKYAQQNGIIAQYAELYGNWGEGPKAWLSAKLQWNPDQDVDALLDEWYERAVGTEAAPYLREYYEHWEHFWTSRITDSDWFNDRKDTTYLAFDDPRYLSLVSEQEMIDSRLLLEETVDKAATDQQKARAELLLRAFEYYEASALSYPKPIETITEQSTALSLLEEGRLDHKLQYAQKRLDLLDQYADDPVLVPSLGINSYPLLSWSGIDSYEFWALADYIKQYEPNGGAVTQVVDDLANGTEPTKMREYANVLQSAGYTMFSLLGNSSFDEGTGIAPWSAWSSNAPETGLATMTRSTEQSYSGNSSMLINNLDRGGPYQTIAVKPGLIAARVQYYMESGTLSDANIQLSFNLLGNNGNVLKTISSEKKPISPTTGQWASIGFMADIPEFVNGVAVKKLQVIVVMNKVEQQTDLYIDDVMVFQSNQDFVTLDNFWDIADYIINNEPGSSLMLQKVEELAQAEELAESSELAQTLLRVIDQDASLLLNVNQANGNVITVLQNFNAATDSLFDGPVAARLHYKVPEGVSENGTIELRVNVYRLENGVPGITGLILKSDVKPLVQHEGEWQAVDLTGMIPEALDARRLQIVLIVSGLSGNQEEIEIGSFELYTNEIESDSNNEESWDFPSTFWNRIDLIAQSGSDSIEMREMLEELAQRSELSEERDYAELLLAILEQSANSLSDNASFESGEEMTPPWSYWVSGSGSMERDTVVFRNGQASLRLNNLVRGGPHQTFAIEPGTFASRVHFYTEGSANGGHIYLSLNLLDENNNVIGNIRTAEKQLNQYTVTWESLDWAGTIPTQVNGVDVAKGQFVVVVDSLGDGNTLYLDDAVFYQNE